VQAGPRPSYIELCTNGHLGAAGGAEENRISQPGSTAQTMRERSLSSSQGCCPGLSSEGRMSWMWRGGSRSPRISNEVASRQAVSPRRADARGPNGAWGYPDGEALGAGRVSACCTSGSMWPSAHTRWFSWMIQENRGGSTSASLIPTLG